MFKIKNYNQEPEEKFNLYFVKRLPEYSEKHYFFKIIITFVFSNFSEDSCTCFWINTITFNFLQKLLKFGKVTNFLYKNIGKIVA